MRSMIEPKRSKSGYFLNRAMSKATNEMKETWEGSKMTYILGAAVLAAIFIAKEYANYAGETNPWREDK